MNGVLTSRSPLPMREKQYVAKEGDMVDALCYNHYGSYEMLFINAVFRRNPLVRSYGLALLPAGLLVILPVITREQVQSIRKFMTWPSVKLVGNSIPRVEVKTPKKDFEVTPVKVAVALAEFRRRQKVKRIAFWDEPPREVITDDPFVPPTVDPPDPPDPPVVVDPPDIVWPFVLPPKRPPQPPWYWSGKPIDPMNDPENDRINDPLVRLTS